MGQLEKYGLYVLCLVIFLILGVAIWGGDPATQPPANKDGMKLAAVHEQGKPADLKTAPENNTGGDQGKTAPAGKTKEPVTKPGSEGEKPNPFSAFIDQPKQGKETPKAGTAEHPAAAGGKGGETSGTKGTIGSDPKNSDPKNIDKGSEGARFHTVQHGDTLHEIAVKELGSASRVSEILALNPGLDPRRMRDGSKVRLPAAKVVTPAPVAIDSPKRDAGTPAAKKVAIDTKPAAGSPYKVKHGDTLTGISRAVYGSDTHVKDILAANRGKLASANLLRENMVLSLPASPTAKHSEPARR